MDGTGVVFLWFSLPSRNHGSGDVWPRLQLRRWASLHMVLKFRGSYLLDEITIPYLPYLLLESLSCVLSCCRMHYRALYFLCMQPLDHVLLAKELFAAVIEDKPCQVVQISMDGVLQSIRPSISKRNKQNNQRRWRSIWADGFVGGGEGPLLFINIKSNHDPALKHRYPLIHPHQILIYCVFLPWDWLEGTYIYHLKLGWPYNCWYERCFVLSCLVVWCSNEAAMFLFR